MSIQTPPKIIPADCRPRPWDTRGIGEKGRKYGWKPTDDFCEIQGFPLLTGKELFMGQEKCKKRLKRGGASVPRKDPRDAKTTDSRRKTRHDRIKESGPAILFSTPQLAFELSEFAESYCKKKAVLLPVDPYLLHIYWEIAPVDLQEAKCLLGDSHGESTETLRCYDVSKNASSEIHFHDSFDVQIDMKAGSWYLHVWRPERSYFVELGLKTRNNSRFFAIARSNIAKTPPAYVSPDVQEEYMLVEGDYDRVEAVSAPVEACGEEEIEKGVGAAFLTRIEASEGNARGKDRHDKKKESSLSEMSDRVFTAGVSSWNKVTSQ